MEIKNSEWTAFAEFIAGQSTHQCTKWLEDGTYIVCPFSTIERAYEAFKVWQKDKSYKSHKAVESLYDVDFESQNPISYMYNPELSEEDEAALIAECCEPTLSPSDFDMLENGTVNDEENL